MKKTLSLLLAFLSIGLCANDDLPDNFHITKLENGLEILVIEDASVPLVTLELTVRNGAYTESPEYDGLSHLYEHMFFKANKDYPSQEAFMQRVAELGVVFNGTTSNERVNYFITLGKHNMQNGLEFLNSAMRYPMFLKEEMVKENVVVDGEFERAESNPGFFLQHAVSKAVAGDLYSRTNVIGDHDIIRSATPEKMKIIQEKYYYPNNTLLAVAGDVNRNDVVRMAKEIFGDWEPCDFDPFEKFPIPEFQALTEDTRLVVENENQPVPVFMRTWVGPDTRNDVQATYTADIFSTILSQKTSTFYKEMVESGLAYQVQEYYQTRKYSGPITAILVPNPEKIEEAYAKFNEQIELWDSDDYFTDEQIATAKKMMAISDAYGQEKTSDYVHTLTYWWCSADIPYYLNYVDNLNKVTREDLKRYVQTYIKGKNHVTGLLITPDMRAGLNVDGFFKTTTETKDEH